MIDRSIKALLAKYSKHHPFGDIVILVAESADKDTTFVHAHPEYILSWRNYCTLLLWLRRYEQGYSIAVITGHKEFFGLDFIVTKHTLVPRPETEFLVEEALKLLTPEATLIDVGTGSGCIPITILKKYPHEIHAFATDLSDRAIATARKNADKHDVVITFFQGHLLEPVWPYIPNRPLLITANLPYLRPEQFTEEPSIQKEPYSALVGGRTGLEIYHELLTAISRLSQQKICIFEIDPSQSELLTSYVAAHWPSATVTIQKDLAGRDRIATIRF